MAGIDDALERLTTDTGFRAALGQDPRAALADYDLTDDERQLLTSQLSQGAGASGGVEQRTSKSGLAGALGMFDDAVAAAPRDAGLDSVEMQVHDPSTPQADGHKGEIDVESWSWGETQSGWVYDENSSCWIRVSQVGASSDPFDPAMAAGGGEHDPAATGDTIPQDHMSLNFSQVEHTAHDETLTAGDPPEEAVNYYLKLEDVPSDSTADTGAEGGSGTGKANVQDLTLTKYTDPAGDPDQPVIVGSLHNAEEPTPSDGAKEVQDGLSNTVLVSETTNEPDSAGSKTGNVEHAWKVEEGARVDGEDPTDLAGNEPPAEGNKLFVGGLSFGTDDAAPGGGQNEIQFEDTPGTEDTPQENLTDREPSEEPMGSPYLKKACFDNTMDPSSDPDDLVADGNDDRPGSPKLVQPLVNNEVPASDDSHEIEMDVHVGRSEPDDALTAAEAVEEPEPHVPSGTLTVRKAGGDGPVEY